MMVAGQVSGWLRRRKVQAAVCLACGLVLVPAVSAKLQIPESGWIWPILLVAVEACFAFLLVFVIISLFIDREVARARAAGGLVVDPAASEEARASASRGIIGYARRVAAREELAYKQLKADLTLLAAEAVLSRSFAEIADDMAAAGHNERQVRQLLARACDEGLLEHIQGKHRYRIVAASKALPTIADVVRARLPNLAEEPTSEVSKPRSRSRGPSKRARSPQSSSSPSPRPVSRQRPAWVNPGGDAGDVPGLVPSVLRRLRLAGRPVTLYPKLDARTVNACIVAKRHVDKRDGTEQVTAVMVPVSAEVDGDKLRQVAAARQRLFETARSIAPSGAGAGPSVTGARGLADNARVFVDRALLEKEQFYLCAASTRTWVFVRRAEVRRARVPEVSVLKDAPVQKEDTGA
jgi:hypothetical protein